MTSLKERLAIGLDSLVPGAAWSACDDYDTLAATWGEQDDPPTEQSILEAFAIARRKALADEAMGSFAQQKQAPLEVTLQGASRLAPCDPVTLSDLLGELSVMTAQDTTDWRMVDGTRLTLTQADLVAVRDAIRTRTKSLATAVNDVIDNLLAGIRPTQQQAEAFGLDWSAVEEVTA